MGSHSAKLQAAKAANDAVGRLTGKQALIVGGTAGIGQGIAEVLAARGANVTIVGRNEEAAAKVLATLRERNAAGQYTFLKGDVMLLSSCRDVVRRFAESASRLDYVVYCQTKATTQGFTPTSEGFDEKLVLHYYTRVYLTELLLPLLERTAASEANADVRVMSVLSAGVHAPFAAGMKADPTLKDSYSLKNAADAAGFYNDLWVDNAAQEHPTVTFVHAAPGFVASNWGTDLPAAMRCGVRIMQASPAAKTIQDCGEFLAQGLLIPPLKGGFRLIGEHGQEAAKTAEHSTDNVAFLRNHTREVLASHL